MRNLVKIDLIGPSLNDKIEILENLRKEKFNFKEITIWGKSSTEFEILTDSKLYN